jgi:hypothetical protein
MDKIALKVIHIATAILGTFLVANIHTAIQTVLTVARLIYHHLVLHHNLQQNHQASFTMVVLLARSIFTCMLFQVAEATNFI